MFCIFLLGVLLFGTLNLVVSSDVRKLQERISMVSLNASPTYNPESAKSRRLERVARVNEQIREACDSMTISDYKAKGTGLGLVDLEKAIQEATVIKGVDLESACEMLRSSAAGKLGFDGIYQQAVLYGYRGVLKCLLTIPLTEWPMSYDAHLFLAMAYKSAHYNGDFWHARWIESDFHKHRRALYASGNVHLFKYLEKLPKLSQKSSLALSVDFFWKYFETIAWNDAVETVEYLADKLVLADVGEQSYLLFECHSTRIINFLRNRNMLLKLDAGTVGELDTISLDTDIDFDFSVSKDSDASEDSDVNEDVDANEEVDADEALEEKRLESTEDQQAEEHQFIKHNVVIEPGTPTAQTTQSIEQDRHTIGCEEWTLLKKDTNRRIIERLMKCDTSLKEKYRKFSIKALEKEIGLELSRGTDILCLLEVIKANVHLQKEPSELFKYVLESRLISMTTCMQAFFLKNFRHQKLVHAYMAIFYQKPEWDEDLWMRFWFDSRFDLYANVYYLSMNTNLFKDLHQLPQNPKVPLPANTAEQFLEHGVTASAMYDSLAALQYFEHNHALDLNEVAKHLDTFIICGAKKIIGYLVESKYAELGLDQVTTAIKYDQVEIVKLAFLFDFDQFESIVSMPQMFKAKKCIEFFSELYELAQSAKKGVK